MPTTPRSTIRTCVRMCPTNPDRLYQQNHCGIYRIDRPSQEVRRDELVLRCGTDRHEI